MEILRNNRGGPRLCAEGYSYTKKSTTREKIRWQCSQRGAFSCNGCAFTDLEITQLLSASNHCHEPDTNKIEAMKVKNNIKTIALTNSTSTTHIVADAVCTQPLGIRSALGRLDSLKRNIQRLKKNRALRSTDHFGEKFINRNANNNNVMVKPKAVPTRFKQSSSKKATRQDSIEEHMSQAEGDTQLDTTSVFWDIFSMDTFNTFEEFDFFFKKYQDRTRSVFRVKSSCSVIKENERRKQQISLKLKYASVSFVCVHYGSPKQQGLGIRRPKQDYLPCGCNVLVALSVRKNQLFITRTYLQHNHESRSSRSGVAKRKRTNMKKASATESSEDSLGQLSSLFPPIAAKLPKKTENQFGNQGFESKEPETMSSPVQPSFPAAKQEALVQVVKQKPAKSPRPKQNKKLFVASHQRSVMSNLVSLWKNGKLCDASIGNGSSTVLMHKLVLSAVCPKLLSLSNMDIGSHEFLQVNFPSEVSKEALDTFAEFIYTGILDLDPEILKELKIIAKRLDMNEFEQLCDSHLSDHNHQLVSAATSSADLSAYTQTITSNPDMISSVDSPHSAFNTFMSTSSSYTPVINIKQENCGDRLSLVEREPTVVLSEEKDVASLAPNVSENAANFVISPCIKTESILSVDDKFAPGRNSNRSFTSTTSSSLSSSSAIAASRSIASVPSSSTEFAIPSLGTTDVKSTRLKSPPFESDSSPVSSPLETVSSQSSSMKKYSSKSSKSSKSSPPFTIPPKSNTVYPVKLFFNRGDKPPFLTTDSSDAMTDSGSSIQSEKT